MKQAFKSATGTRFGRRWGWDIVFFLDRATLSYDECSRYLCGAGEVRGRHGRKNRRLSGPCEKSFKMPHHPGGDVTLAQASAASLMPRRPRARWRRCDDVEVEASELTTPSIFAAKYLGLNRPVLPPTGRRPRDGETMHTSVGPIEVNVESRTVVCSGRESRWYRSSHLWGEVVGGAFH